MKPSRKGLVLIEVLPAMMILLVVVMLALRMAWEAAELELRGRRARMLESALAPVLEAWKDDEGTVAMARMGADGSWLVSTFPDESWIPEAPASRASGLDDPVVIRRFHWTGPGGRRFWKISYRVAADGSGSAWRNWTAVLE